MGATAPYSGVQVYTFTPSGTVSKVRFDYVDASGLVIQSLSGTDYSNTNNISSACKVTVNYNTTLNTDLQGRTRANALPVDIYAVYNDGATGNGTERSVKLTATLSDCACCGAKTTSGGWLNFMCHNLGANENLDPFTHNTGLYGSYYQWGNKTAGWVANGGASSNTAWGNGTQNENVPKATNDPCPAGWKVPSQKQWQSIYKASGNGAPSAATANTWTWTGNGFKVGDALYLPAAGYRSNSDGSLNRVGSTGYYWSSTVTETDSYYLYFDSGYVNPDASDGARSFSQSVRCVSE